MNAEALIHNQTGQTIYAIVQTDGGYAIRSVADGRSISAEAVLFDAVIGDSSEFATHAMRLPSGRAGQTPEFNLTLENGRIEVEDVGLGIVNNSLIIAANARDVVRQIRDGHEHREYGHWQTIEDFFSGEPQFLSGIRESTPHRLPDHLRTDASAIDTAHTAIDQALHALGLDQLEIDGTYEEASIHLAVAPESGISGKEAGEPDLFLS